MSLNWMKWCRVCAKQETDNSVTTLESFNNLRLILEKHLFVTANEDNPMPSSLCTECYDFIKKLEKFSERCDKVEKLFYRLRACSNLNLEINDLQTIRYEHGLDLEDKFSGFPVLKYDNTTDIDNLSIIECLIPQTNGSPKIIKRARSKRSHDIAKVREERAQDYVQVKDETQLEIQPTIDYEVDDYENDPSFEIETEQNDDDEEYVSNENEIEETLVNSEFYNCSICYLDFDQKNVYENHNRTHHSSTSHVCSLCTKSFKTSRILKRHQVTHLPDAIKLPHPCKFCDKRFSKLVNVQAHVRAIHTGDRPHICEECGKGFVSKKALGLHQRTHLPDAKKLLYGCKFCDKRFSQSSNVQAHERAMHTGDRPFICEECGKSCITKGALKQHQIVHSDDSPFQCSHCPKKFKSIARLRKHENNRSKDAAFECAYCGRKLITKYKLRLHMDVHSDQKRFKCQYCGKEFKRSNALKNHLILHTGQRPYTCPFCERTFANNSNCRKHKKNVHPVELAAFEASNEKQTATVMQGVEKLQQRLIRK